MRKLVSIIILLGVAWLAKLSYDMWQISRTVPELKQSLLQSEQHYANLNDQLVALKRQTQTQSSSDVQTAPLTNHEIIHTGIAPTVVIKQKLDLINKGIDIESNTRFVNWCHEIELKVKAYLIAGLPGESKETMEEKGLI